MKSENKKVIIAMIAAVAVVCGGYVFLMSYTGLDVPFSVVMSQSMQHDNSRSEIGCIDTGDLVIVQDPDKADIQSYVEGSISGHSTFGDYGSVIIYYGNNVNPIIHRTIVWLEWSEETQTWSAPSLADYKGEWRCMYHGVETKDCNNLVGKLWFFDLTQSKKDVYVDLELLKKESGYLTLGDNPVSNRTFDQISGIARGPISLDEIKSVPIAEIPWVGTLKIMIKNDGSHLEYVPNSFPSLIMTIIMIFGIIMTFDVITINRNTIKIKNSIKK